LSKQFLDKANIALPNLLKLTAKLENVFYFNEILSSI